jgi:hypothetical protein
MLHLSVLLVKTAVQLHQVGPTASEHTAGIRKRDPSVVEL